MTALWGERPSLADVRMRAALYLGRDVPATEHVADTVNEVLATAERDAAQLRRLRNTVRGACPACGVVDCGHFVKIVDDRIVHLEDRS